MSTKTPFKLVDGSFIETETGEAGYDEMQPGGICHYSGPGSDLPLGGYSYIPGWGPERAAKRWLVADQETESGTRQKKTSELGPDDIIIGVELHPGVISAMVATYGPGFYQIREANGGPLLTAAQWKEQFGTDGMALVAIRNMRKLLKEGLK
jgi:hypothetical protein